MGGQVGTGDDQPEERRCEILGIFNTSTAKAILSEVLAASGKIIWNFRGKQSGGGEGTQEGWLCVYF